MHFYDVNVKWEELKKGVLSSSALNSAIEVVTPPEFPGGIAGVWSPEHLLVAAVNSCLMTTFLAIAENSGLEFVNFESNATGKLERVEGKYLISEIEMRPVLTLPDEQHKDKALRILHKSEAACLISNSVRSKITMIPEIKY